MQTRILVKYHAEQSIIDMRFTFFFTFSMLMLVIRLKKKIVFDNSFFCVQHKENNPNDFNWQLAVLFLFVKKKH